MPFIFIQLNSAQCYDVILTKCLWGNKFVLCRDINSAFTRISCFSAVLPTTSNHNGGIIWSNVCDVHAFRIQLHLFREYTLQLYISFVKIHSLYSDAHVYTDMILH